jgi:peptide deformylase
MKSAFLPPGDPRLFKPSQPVTKTELSSASFRSVIRSMHTVAAAHQTNRQRPVLVGIAASQLGIPKRMILIDIMANGHGEVAGSLELIINPVVTHTSDETQEWYEGCYSTGSICGIVHRPTRITVAGLNETGTPASWNLEGYRARIALHEIDHLDGRFFIDHITDDAKLHLVEANDFPVYRDAEGWRNWPHLCPRSRWEALVGSSRPSSD